MKKNIAILELSEYNRLKRYESKISEEKKKHTIYVTQTAFNSEICYTDDEAVKELAEELKETKELLYKQRDNNSLNSRTIQDVAKMSLWEFLKWRKKVKKSNDFLKSTKTI